MGLFDKSDVFEIELIQLDLFELEQFHLDSFTNRLFGMFDSIKRKKKQKKKKEERKTGCIVKVTWAKWSCS